MAADSLTFTYRLRFDDDSVKEFNVQLDRNTLDLIPDENSDLPEWTRLDFHCCTNCPLDPQLHTHCPIAVNMIDLIEDVKDLVSHQEVDVIVETENRTYQKRVDIQSVIGSLIGIYMPTSGCPILNKLRPMVETHLPFSTAEDTIYRMVSMYLFAQYCLQKHGLVPNWDLKGLSAILAEVQTVNTCFCRRLGAIKTIDKDAHLNAINILHSLSFMTSMSIDTDELRHWERLFITHYAPG